MDTDRLLEYMLIARTDFSIASIVMILAFYFAKPLYAALCNTISYYRNYKYNIKFEGYISTSLNGNTVFRLPEPMRAIGAFMIKNKLASNLDFIEADRETYMYDEFGNMIQGEVDINACYSYKMRESSVTYKHERGDIDVCTSEEDVKVDKCGTCLKKIQITIMSRVLTIAELEEFVRGAVSEYRFNNDIKNKNKTYHFIYSGHTDGAPDFYQRLLSDYNDPLTVNNESFDHIFHTHKERLISDVKRLHDVQYYKERGLKRKCGYLFYGPPGCGKTATVAAIANMDRRHILEIPLNRVKSSSDFEQLLFFAEIGGIKLTDENTIILLDEIDCADAVHKKPAAQNDNKCSGDDDTASDTASDSDSDTASDNNNHRKSKKKSRNEKNENNLDIYTILSRTDGVGNYNGKIMIATSNNKEIINPALCRNGRFTPLYFGAVSGNDVADIIHDYYKCDDPIDVLNIEITPVTLRDICSRNETIEECMEELSQFNNR